MEKLTQTSLYPKGNCWQTCVAALLGVLPETLPDQTKITDREAYADALRAYLKKHHGLTYVEVEPGTVPQVVSGNVVHVIAGETVRTPDTGVWHAVLGRGGEIAWDVHPSRVGLTRILKWGLLVPFETAPEAWKEEWEKRERAGDESVSCRCAKCYLTHTENGSDNRPTARTRRNLETVRNGAFDVSSRCARSVDAPRRKRTGESPAAYVHRSTQELSSFTDSSFKVKAYAPDVIRPVTGLTPFGMGSQSFLSNENAVAASEDVVARAPFDDDGARNRTNPFFMKKGCARSGLAAGERQSHNVWPQRSMSRRFLENISTLLSPACGPITDRTTRSEVMASLSRLFILLTHLWSVIARCFSSARSFRAPGRETDTVLFQDTKHRLLGRPEALGDSRDGGAVHARERDEVPRLDGESALVELGALRDVLPLECVEDGLVGDVGEVLPDESGGLALRVPLGDLGFLLGGKVPLGSHESASLVDVSRYSDVITLGCQDLNGSYRTCNLREAA